MQETTSNPTKTTLRTVTAGWLYEQYVTKGYSDREIAEALGVTRQAVQQWRAYHGIARPQKPRLERPA